MGGEGLRHVVHRRVHKERPQPAERKRLGYLEKHKDYVKRAKDYHEKQDKLKELHKKAFFRNQDEFAFSMVSTKQGKDGTVMTKGGKLSNEELMLLNSQDSKYIHMREQVDKKAIEKQSRGLHFLDAPAEGKHTLFLDDEDLNLEPSRNAVTPAAASNAAKTTKLKDFDVARHLDTHPELLKRKSNRLRMEQIRTQKIVDTAEVVDATKESYHHLVQRQERAKKLANIGNHLDLRHHLRKKGRRIKVADEKDGKPAVFKWDPQRKK
mmetsp:Transcript_27349/g.63081  ORF Transcript_27349/g.63081 Transcript_27349/m.63081 type:complete len:266 (+) Transcript_27349:85-882(+)